MPTIYSLTSTLALANLRTDLNDTDNTQYRWQDAQLNRALDRALERLTAVEPQLATVQVQAIQDARIYAVPSGSLWIDRVEYPQGQWPPNFPNFREYKSPTLLDPATAPTAALGSGGGLGAGNYQWAYTFTTPGGGETKPSPIVQLAATAGKSATVYVPTGTYGVTGRNIYRTRVGLTQLQLAGTLADNSSTSFLDTIADGSLGVNAPTSNTTGGTDVFELVIPQEQAPGDSVSSTLEITYALKHELDGSGTTLPERHWDTLYKGAMAFAVDMYLASINDNFEYADGTLRDRVDDTKSVDAWRAWRDELMLDFNQRLKAIQNEQLAAVALVQHWGDKPIRWERV